MLKPGQMANSAGNITGITVTIGKKPSQRRTMTSITLTEEMQGNLEPQWWIPPFVIGVMVGAGLIIAAVTIMLGGRFL